MENLKFEIATSITQKTQTLAEKIVNKQYALKPDYWNAYGERGRLLSLRDAAYHIPFLTEAMQSGDADIFCDYVSWVKQLFKGLNLADDTILQTLECTREALYEEIPEEMAVMADHIIQSGINQLSVSVKPIDKSYLDEGTAIGLLGKTYINYLLTGDRNSASKLIITEVEKGTSLKDIYLNVFQKSQYEIGRLWLTNQISVAKEHFCSAATQLIMSQLYPYLFTTERVGHKLVSACVGGELHEIGIRMVTDFFEMEGWDTYYLGANTPGSIILKAIDEYQAEVVGLSIAMPYHRSLLKEIISDIKSSNVGKNTVILIGGNAVNSRSHNWEWFGADAYAPDALTAVEKAKKLISA